MPFGDVQRSARYGDRIGDRRCSHGPSGVRLAGPIRSAGSGPGPLACADIRLFAARLVAYDGSVFERFTAHARQAIVLAQQEGRALGHNYLGTEHLLLGLIIEPECTAAQILHRFKMEPNQLRNDIVAAIGRGTETPTGHIPFTPAAKRVMEVSLREALRLGHNYIGSEHLLLAVVAENSDVTGQVLSTYNVTAPVVRDLVIELAASDEPVLPPRVSTTVSHGLVPELGSGIATGFLPVINRESELGIVLVVLTLVGSILSDNTSVLFEVAVVATIAAVIGATAIAVAKLWPPHPWLRWISIPTTLALGIAATAFCLSSL